MSAGELTVQEACQKQDGNITSRLEAAMSRQPLTYIIAQSV